MVAPQLMILEASSVFHEMSWREEINKQRAKQLLTRLLKADMRFALQAALPRPPGMLPTSSGGSRPTTRSTWRSRECLTASW